jgi:glucose/arabinose dehydrogenase
VNVGSKPAEKTLPFKIETIAQFATPWAMAFIPDGRLLVTEKEGRVFLTAQAGEKLEVSGVPVVKYSGQNSLLDIAAAQDATATYTRSSNQAAPPTTIG